MADEKTRYCERYGKHLTYPEWIKEGEDRGLFTRAFKKTDARLYRYWENGSSVEFAIDKFKVAIMS